MTFRIIDFSLLHDVSLGLHHHADRTATTKCLCDRPPRDTCAITSQPCFPFLPCATRALSPRGAESDLRSERGHAAPTSSCTLESRLVTRNIATGSIRRFPGLPSTTPPCWPPAILSERRRAVCTQVFSPLGCVVKNVGW